MTMGRPYPQWLKAWRKAGKPAFPVHAKIVAVHWVDACSSHDDDAGLVECVMVGFVKSATDESITLAMEIGEDKACRMTFIVPAGMVKRVIDLATLQAFPSGGD